MSRFTIGLVLVIALAWTHPARAKNPVTYQIHTVKKGDTLSRIAKRYGVTIRYVRQLNRLKANRFIRPGQRLKVKRQLKRQRRAAARSSKAKRRSIAVKRTQRRRGGHWVTYKVKKGDNLWRIADRYDVSLRELIRVNRLGKRPKIFPGDLIRVKRRGSHILSGGVVLPRRGPGYKAIRPQRSWGTPGTVRLMQKVYSDFAKLHPNSVPGLIADLSKSGGGYLPPHKSHQRGIDADVSYFKKNNTRLRGLEVVTPDTIDLVKTWDLLRLYLNTGRMKVIFMDYKLQKALHQHLVAVGYNKDDLLKILQYPRPRSKKKGLIRHSRGHHHHLHVRFSCIKAKTPCHPLSTPMVAQRLLPKPEPAVPDMDLLETERFDAFAGVNLKNVLNIKIISPETDQTTSRVGALPRPAAVENRRQQAHITPALRSAASAQSHARRTLEIEPPDWFADFKIGPPIPWKKLAGSMTTARPPMQRGAEAPTRMTRFGPHAR